MLTAALGQTDVCIPAGNGWKEKGDSVSSSGSGIGKMGVNSAGNMAFTGHGESVVSLCSFKYCVPYIVLMTRGGLKYKKP